MAKLSIATGHAMQIYNCLYRTIKIIINLHSMTTDLKNRTGLSVYFWETEANGGHIEGTTWGVQWRYTLGVLFKMAANWLQNRFITTMSCSIQSYFWDQWAWPAYHISPLFLYHWNDVIYALLSSGRPLDNAHLFIVHARYGTLSRNHWGNVQTFHFLKTNLRIC